MPFPGCCLSGKVLILQRKSQKPPPSSSTRRAPARSNQALTSKLKFNSRTRLGQQSLPQSPLHNEGAPPLLRVEACLFQFASLWVTDVPDLWVKSVVSKGYRSSKLISHHFPLSNQADYPRTVSFAECPEPSLVPENHRTSITTGQVQGIPLKPVYGSKAQLGLFILSWTLNPSTNSSKFQNITWIMQGQQLPLQDEGSAWHLWTSKMLIYMFPSTRFISYFYALQWQYTNSSLWHCPLAYPLLPVYSLRA